MKAICLTNRGGYEYALTQGKEYLITDIQEAIFAGDYYAIGIGDDDQHFACHLYRFNIDKETARAYVAEHHAD